MYAVIFKAKINILDEQYADVAKKMRKLALEQYHCVDFTSVTEADNEIAISYWNDLEDIKKWKQDPEHLKAQELGGMQFYRSYQVQVVEILREYKG